MLHHLIYKQLDKAEKTLGVSMDYLRHVADASRALFVKFALVMPLVGHRRALPKAAYHVARLVAVRHEDCGACVQINVNIALQDGVAPELLRAVLNGRPADLTPPLADVYHFAATICAGRDDDALRERIRHHFGEEGLVELALGIAITYVFPVTKRALGYAQHCTRVELPTRDRTGTHAIPVAPLAVPQE